MRVCFDKDGYVEGCMQSNGENGCFMTENDVVLPLPDGMTFEAFAKVSHLYRLVGGVLVRDENRVIEKPVPQPSVVERLAALEAAMLEMMGVTADG